MLNNDQLNIIGAALTPLFQNLETEIIADVARRVSNTATYTRTAELEAIAMRKLGFSPSQIRSEAMKLLRANKQYRMQVAKNTLEYKREVRDLINQITKDAYKAGNAIVAGAGDMSWYSDLKIWKDNGFKLPPNNALTQLVRATQKQLRGTIKNLTRSTGFMSMGGFQPIMNLYQNELDKAVIKIMSGTLSQDKVAQDVVHNLAQSGLRSIDYSSGHTDQLSVAVERALRTGCQQISAKIQDTNMQESELNLVIVQEHAGARNVGSGVENHAEWQGKVYYIKPGHNYAAEEARLGYPIRDLYDATGYSVDGSQPNDPLGLFGYNCRHLYFPWFEGISEAPKPQKAKKTITYNEKPLDYYAQTQEARKQERNIRRLKREKEALKSLKQDTKPIQKQIDAAEQTYNGFLHRCNMPRGNRTRYEAGTADITQTDAYQDYMKAKAKAQEAAGAP